MENKQSISPAILTSGLSVGYKNHQKESVLISDINLEIWPGEMVSLVGPNGSGKTTLIRTLTGLQKPLTGNVLIGKKNINNLNAFQRAGLFSVVLTEPVFEKNLSVFELVSLGRYTYTNWYGNITRIDKVKIDHAIEKVGLDSKRHESLSKLSDGERQRALLAKALAQDVDLIMLDEPTAHLDLPNKVEIFSLLHQMAESMNKAVLLSTHELELAFRVSDKISLIQKETHHLLTNTPEDLIVGGYINETFGSNKIRFNNHTASFELINKRDLNAVVEGRGIIIESTKRLLRRYGFTIISENQNADIIVKENTADDEIIIEYKNIDYRFATFLQLQDFIRKSFMH